MTDTQSWFAARVAGDVGTLATREADGLEVDHSRPCRHPNAVKPPGAGTHGAAVFRGRSGTHEASHVRRTSRFPVLLLSCCALLSCASTNRALELRERIRAARDASPQAATAAPPPQAPPPQAPPPPQASQGSRLFASLSQSSSVVTSVIKPYGVDLGTWLLGVSAGLGAQLTDRLAVYFLGSASVGVSLPWFIPHSDLSASLMLEGSPTNQWSLAAGPGITRATSGSVEVLMLGLPVRASLTFPSRARGPTTFGSGLRLSFESSFLLALPTEGVSSVARPVLRFGITMGYVLR